MPISQDVERKDAREKVTGQAKYGADDISRGTLFARLLTSPVAHGLLKGVDVSSASNAPGVVIVVTGSDQHKLTGVLLQDRPPLAYGRVRYMGEPIAVVVAMTEAEAEAAVRLIKIDLEPLDTVNSIADAMRPDAMILHPDANDYACLVDDVNPIPGTNVAASFRIRKGDMKSGWDAANRVVEKRFFIPHAEHMAMETHFVESELKADGTLRIKSATQSPYTVRELVDGFLGISPGKVLVETALLGGAFGGKSAVQLEYIAALIALAVPGKSIRLIITREQDMASCANKLALEAVIKLGADESGRFTASEMTYVLDCGAYSDISPNMSKSIAVDCTGPYRLDNLSCDSMCVYTNHTYSTAYRGFGHEALTFCVERTIDSLADALGMDPFAVREINAINPGNYTPTQVEATLSNMGNLPECLKKLREQCLWDDGFCRAFDNGKVRAKGVACLWKTPNPSTDASAGAIITFNPDGSCNLQVGVVEMGNGGKTHLCQMVADRLRMDYDRVHVRLEVDTRTTPEYFKTVASLSAYLAGKAVVNAADDALNQLKKLAALVLKCETTDLDYGHEKVFLASNPKFAVGYQDLAGGVKLPDKNAIGQPVIGRGSSVMRHLGTLAEDTGRGKAGHAWTVGAQAVEIELDTREMTYRLLKAWTVMDVGSIIDEAATRSMIMGGMAMGLSMARNEECVYDGNCLMENTSMRTYKVAHIGEEPRFFVEFVTTPQLDAPFGARSYSEHGIIGMPAALANAVSRAAGINVDMLPVTHESVWRATGKGDGA